MAPNGRAPVRQILSRAAHSVIPAAAGDAEPHVAVLAIKATRGPWAVVFRGTMQMKLGHELIGVVGPQHCEKDTLVARAHDALRVLLQGQTRLPQGLDVGGPGHGHLGHQALREE